MIHDYNVEQAARFIGLGVKIDPKLDLGNQINSCANKAKEALTFIKRWTKDQYIMKLLLLHLLDPFWLMVRFQGILTYQL